MTNEKNDADLLGSVSPRQRDGSSPVEVLAFQSNHRI